MQVGRATSSPTDVFLPTVTKDPPFFWSQGLLFVAAFLAGVLHPAMVHLRANAIGRTALTAFHVQPGLALRDGHVPCHRLSYQALGLLAHGFL